MSENKNVPSQALTNQQRILTVGLLTAGLTAGNLSATMQSEYSEQGPVQNNEASGDIPEVSHDTAELILPEVAPTPKPSDIQINHVGAKTVAITVSTPKPVASPQSTQPVTKPIEAPSLPSLPVPRTEPSEQPITQEVPESKPSAEPSPDKGGGGDYPGNPEFPQTPETPEAERPIIEGGQITPEANAAMATETVYLEGVGCSGALIRNQANEPIGIMTAEHCSLRSIHEDRLDGSDGQTYIVREPVIAQSGDDEDSLTDIGTVTTFRLPAKQDNSEDLAFGAFEGSTIDDVIANYKHLDVAEINQLKQGDTVYMSGWPVDQDNNPGSMDRQAFAMTVLGLERVNISSGENINVLWAAATSTDQGVECSFGASGSQGFIMDPETGARSVGTLAAFSDLKGDTYGSPEQGMSSREYYNNMFGVTLGDDIATVCGFAYELPGTHAPAETVTIVSSAMDVPGYAEKISEAGTIASAREQLLDPKAEKLIIDGVVGVSDGGPEPARYIVRPTIYVNPITNAFALGYRDDTAPDKLAFSYVEFPSNVKVYALDDNSFVGLGQVNTKLEDGKNGFNVAKFGDFAYQFTEDPKTLGTVYIMDLKDDLPYFFEALVNKGGDIANTYK